MPSRTDWSALLFLPSLAIFVIALTSDMAGRSGLFQSWMSRFIAINVFCLLYFACSFALVKGIRSTRHNKENSSREDSKG